jgi:cytochrome bd-type quinol oxidase subunit 2
MWRKRRKTVLVAVSLLYVLFGILAFFNIPGGHDEHHHSFAHNLTHIILGLVLFGVTVRFPPAVRQKLCVAFAFAYFIISFLGAIIGKQATLVIIPGLVEFHAGDYTVHLATGLLFAALGLLKRSDQRPVPA